MTKKNNPGISLFSSEEKQKKVLTMLDTLIEMSPKNVVTSPVVKSPAASKTSLKQKLPAMDKPGEHSCSCGTLLKLEDDRSIHEPSAPPLALVTILPGRVLP